MSGWRHPDLGRVDRDAPLKFTFDGREFGGFAGDTLASALLASGERILGRSFKYHRPRGLWGMAGEEPNAIFDVTDQGMTIPNQRATTVALRDGMAARSVNTSPDARRDRLGLLDLAHRFLPAGFYYKTFMAMGWMRWEPMIRGMAGLGRLDPGTHPPADIPQVTARCDTLIIGAGPAGLAAARAAARQGASVFLIDEAAETGGALRWRGGDIEGGCWRQFARDTEEAVRAAGGQVMCDTTVWGAFDHGMFAAWERRDAAPDRHWRIRAGQVILAAGAIERPLWFANNDRPGVMSAEAALHYLKLHGAVAGKRILMGTANDATYPVAAAFARAGCRVTLADARSDTPPPPEGVELLRRARITAAHGARQIGAATVEGAYIDADTILGSGGYTPSVHLFCQAGGKLDWAENSDALVPRPGSAAMAVAGAANGGFGLADALEQGHAAAGGIGPAPRAVAVSWSLAPLRPDPTLRGRQWIDPQNDVTLKDVKLAAQEGFRSVEHLKRYTTLGMATDQGRSANFAALATMAVLTERSIPQTGTTTYRPPFVPVPLSVIAGPRRGALFAPPKRLPLEAAHVAAGGRLREYGGWLRPAWYDQPHGPPKAEADAVHAEALTARSTVAAYDASPLGKIEVIGPDAAALLDFCGYMRMSTLKPGRARYGFMLSETGVVHDDGVVLRLEENRFILSASSGHVTSARMILEEARQDRFDPSRVFVHDVTQNWVTLTVSGPRARDVLRGAGLPATLCDDGALAHMGVVETTWRDVPLRVARISFTGDRSYELSVSARHGAALRAALDTAIRHAAGAWIGLEAVMVLRAEKGFVLVGKDTDGVTMPHDLGWPGPRDRRADEYVGCRSLFTQEALRSDRRQLVGLSTDGKAPLPVGAHILASGDGLHRSVGFVTSSCHSPVLGHPIALGMVEAGRVMLGTEVSVFHLGQVTTARITPVCAFDPEGKRLHE